jgi:hypothetical protein
MHSLTENNTGARHWNLNHEQIMYILLSNCGQQLSKFLICIIRVSQDPSDSFTLDSNEVVGQSPYASDQQNDQSSSGWSSTSGIINIQHHDQSCLVFSVVSTLNSMWPKSMLAVRAVIANPHRVRLQINVVSQFSIRICGDRWIMDNLDGIILFMSLFIVEPATSFQKSETSSSITVLIHREVSVTLFSTSHVLFQIVCDGRPWSHHKQQDFSR